ncbi:MAG TPA: 23S rRNA (uracil(1939)-C(5))-methyltransferase RlmD [Coriobacteriia bacterium]|nr:23S rRNA (uracil(1939)-C(5))-methyltransferase RlmD [Coriobacteriia bacterium]
MPHLSIERLSYGPDAIARLEDGRTAFVSGACPGDVVDAEVIADHGRYVNASTKSVIEPSADRVTPPCPYFGVCGGCQWQHVAEAVQLISKRQAVVDALRRIGHIEAAEERVGETLASPAYGYRNKIELVAEHRGGKLIVGFHRAASGDIIPVDSCLLLPKRFQKAPKALSGALRYVAGSTDLGISRVALRIARNTKDIEVALWTPPSSFPRQAAARTLGQALPLSSLVRVLYKGAPKERSVSKVEALSGRGSWTERLGEFSYTISAPSFFQTNTKMAEKLVELVLEILQPDGSDVVLDLYSGAGTFTLPLAELAGEVVAIESYGPAVRDLRRNLESAQSWAEVVGGDAAREIETLGYADLAVVDPPRAGLDPAVIAALARLRPRALAYVSCDPATLARDAKALEEAGLTLVSATPVDLFPQTFHVETVAHFAPA